MVRVTALTSPLLLGFDDLERALDKVSKTGADGCKALSGSCCSLARRIHLT